MRTDIKFEKKIAAQINGILKCVESLPKGKRNAVKSKCGKIMCYAMKAQSLSDTYAALLRS